MSSLDKDLGGAEVSQDVVERDSTAQIIDIDPLQPETVDDSAKIDSITNNANETNNHNTTSDHEGPAQKRLKVENESTETSDTKQLQTDPSLDNIHAFTMKDEIQHNPTNGNTTSLPITDSTIPKQEVIDLLNSPLLESKELEIISETRINDTQPVSRNIPIKSEVIIPPSILESTYMTYENKYNNKGKYFPTIQKPATFSPITTTQPVIKNRLILLYDKLRYYHLIMHLSELRKRSNEKVIILELPQFDKLIQDNYISAIQFDYLNINIEYSPNFKENLSTISHFIQANPTVFTKIPNISYLIHFAPNKKWGEYTLPEKDQYYHFLDTLSKVAGDNVTQCSIINKYDMNTVYITDKNELDSLGNEIQQDISRWKNLRILDFGESSIRSFPGAVKLPDSLEILNIGGGYALETLTGFKMPSKLKTLLAGQGALHTIDNLSLPPSLERLELCDNKIYYLSYFELPSRLQHLDISQNRLDNLANVNFPHSMISLNIAYNPIESIKTVRFPDNLQYLDVSNVPNESMAGIKFPDLLINLNLQASMTSTRGLRLPPFLSTLNLCDNGVNSINPLKLPNSLSVLYLNNNNIKTLNKVQFPTNLKELYLGNNMITTLKNVQFPSTLEVLDMEMDPEYDEYEKHLTTLKDVIFPPNLKVLKLGYHSIKLIESFEFPYSLTTLSLSYNELKILRNVRFGNNLKVLDLSGNKELTNIDHILIPDSVTDLRVPPELVANLPPYIVDRVNKKQLLLKQSMSF